MGAKREGEEGIERGRNDADSHIIEVSLLASQKLACVWVMWIFDSPSPSPSPTHYSLPPGTEESKEVQEKMGIMVHYNVKIRCVVSFGS